MSPAEAKAVRRELRLSANGMAEAVGVADGSRIRKWERGADPVPASVQVTMARLLEEWRRAMAIVEAMVLPRLESEIAARGARPGSVALTHYADAETLAALRPDDPSLTLSLHRAVNRATAWALKQRGIAVELVPVAVDDYRAWLGDGPNDADARARFAAEHARKVPYRLGFSIGPNWIAWSAMRLGPERAD